MNIVGLPDQQYGNLFIDPKARAAYDSFLTINYLEFPEAADMYMSYATKAGLQNFNGYTDRRGRPAQGPGHPGPDPARPVRHRRPGRDRPGPAVDPDRRPARPGVPEPRRHRRPLTFSYMDNAWAAAMGAP
ncbi:hypothetical protein GXW82_19035 [Streptacidiphilus sp. 4-A2]|nr:hypothetical protein [Streptacidiphilus sp. 4-A2]